MNTVKCSNRLCEKEYNVQFDNCPFCGTANPMEENERRALPEKENSDTELKAKGTNGEKFSGWVTGIIWLNIMFGGIRGIINSTTMMIYSPVWGAVDFGLQIIGIISLVFLLLAKKWALYLWVGYLIAISIINGYLSNNDYFTFAIVAAIKLVLMFLFLQIRKDGVSAWSIIFNKKKVDATNNNVNIAQAVEEHVKNEFPDVKNDNTSDTIMSEIEEELAIEASDNKDVNPTVDSYLTADKGTAQVEETVEILQKETTSEELDRTQAEAKKGRNKNKHTDIKIGKWWIFSLIVVATLAIVWFVVWFSHRPKEPELGKYVYVDEYSILHINRNCDKIADIHGTKPVTIFAINELTQGKWKHECSYCVSDTIYERIEQQIILHSKGGERPKPVVDEKQVIFNDNLRRLHNSLKAENKYNLPARYKDFEKDMRDENKLRKVHSNLIKFGYLMPDYDIFKCDMGLDPVHPTTRRFDLKKTNKRLLFEYLSEEYDMESFEQFSLDVEDETKRMKLFNAIKEEYEIRDFEQFTRYLINNECFK